MKLPTLNKKRKIILLTACIAVALPIMALGFIKYALPPILVSQYKHQINQAFDTFFDQELQQRIEKLGVTFSMDRPVECSNGPYSSSSPCSRFKGSEYTRLDQNAIDEWRHSGAALDEYLTKQGWERTAGNRQGTFENFTTISPLEYQTFVGYTKKQHGVTCTVYADYIRDHYPDIGSISVGEHCYKYTASPSEWL